ncbi:hypothetical protein GXY_11504 [Novacetimonas hansenii ATCC 23769]|uniref:UPF0335 protein GXY_11504 n=3 Tax=Novacetimonas hansenii TaxID=436 RepID=D5QGM9_NOVHA|nr:hypothetical protein GXY_11504 [Novacetimonas hansenii ATCC 23769]
MEHVKLALTRVHHRDKPAVQIRYACRLLVGGMAGCMTAPSLYPEAADMSADNFETDDSSAAVGGIAADRLRSIIERVERLEEERKALAGDIKDIYTEAKSAGFDTKVIRQIIRLRKQEPAEVEEQETLLDIYRRALGM